MSSPQLWGSYAWHLLHTVAYSAICCSHYNPYRQFFKTYVTIMPCNECTIHYAEWLEQNPLHNVTDFSTWVHKLHNNIHKRLDKKTLHQQYFKDGVLQISHDKIFKWIDIVVQNAIEDSNIDIFQDYIIFFKTLRDIFPCPSCGAKLRELMDVHSIDNVIDAKTLQEWYKCISSLWKEDHLYLQTNVYIVYTNKNGLFYRRINMRDTYHIKRDGNTIRLDKKYTITIPSNLSNANIVTEAELEYIKKVVTT